MKKKNLFLDIISSNYFIFVVATAVMLAFTMNIDLTSYSGDAQETWLVAKSFFSGKRYYSYTMYKGVYAFIPSVIDYNLSVFLHIPEMLFLKVTNALSFAYVAVFGIPNLIKALFKLEKVAAVKRYLVVALMVIFERNIIYYISVDMMSCMLFVLLCTAALKATQNTEKLVKNSIIVGVLFGLNCCFSGQFLISAVIVMIAFIIKLFVMLKKQENIAAKKRYLNFLMSVGIVAAAYIIARLPNDIYMNLIVYPAKAKGEWIPSGHDWIINGLSANIKIINYPRCLPDKLSMSLLSEEQLSMIDNGHLLFTIPSYFKLILRNPIVFILRWSERLFLGVYNDPHNYIYDIAISVTGHICVMAILVFSFYDTLKMIFKKYSDIISLEFAVYIAFLFSALVPTFGHVENRYYFTMRCLIYGTFACTPFLDNAFSSVKSKFKNRKGEGVKVGYKLYSCILFCLLSLIIYMALYQSAL